MSTYLLFWLKGPTFSHPSTFALLSIFPQFTSLLDLSFFDRNLHSLPLEFFPLLTPLEPSLVDSPFFI